MGDKEYKAYKKLSLKGQAKYGADRAAEAEQKGGKWPVTLAALYRGDYNAY